jgi:hypothetical protein
MIQQQQSELQNYDEQQAACFFASNSTTTIPAQQFDPLFPGSGGSQVRSDVFAQRQALSPIWAQRAANAGAGLVAQATSPLWGNAFNLYSGQVNGDYLGGSPQLTDQINTMRAQSAREAGDQQADIASRYARTGNSLSTGVNQQLINAGAAARARSDASQAQLLGNNYLRERDIQQRSTEGAQTASTVPANLNALANLNQFDPLSRSAQLAVQLSGGGQIAAPDVVQQPNGLNAALGAASALG